MKAHELAKSFTEKQIRNIENYWGESDAESLKTYQSLVRLGDSKSLAMATVLINKKNENKNNENYYAAYCI